MQDHFQVCFNQWTLERQSFHGLGDRGEDFCEERGLDVLRLGCGGRALFRSNRDGSWWVRGMVLLNDSLFLRKEKVLS